MIISVGRSRIAENEIEQAYFNNLYVVNYSGVFQIHYSNASKIYYCIKLISEKGLTKRGTYTFKSAEEINTLLNCVILC